MIELKPCPFCGTTSVSMTKKKGRFAVRCNFCGTRFGIREKTVDDAAKAWNTRPDTGAMRGSVSLLRKARDRFELPLGAKVLIDQVISALSTPKPEGEQGGEVVSYQWRDINGKLHTVKPSKESARLNPSKPEPEDIPEPHEDCPDDCHYCHPVTYEKCTGRKKGAKPEPVGDDEAFKAWWFNGLEGAEGDVIGHVEMEDAEAIWNAALSARQPVEEKG